MEILKKPEFHKNRSVTFNHTLRAGCNNAWATCYEKNLTQSELYYKSLNLNPKKYYAILCSEKLEMDFKT